MYYSTQEIQKIIILTTQTHFSSQDSAFFSSISNFQQPLTSLQLVNFKHNLNTENTYLSVIATFKNSQAAKLFKFSSKRQANNTYVFSLVSSQEVS